jgi:hypothetical protein
MSRNRTASNPGAETANKVPWSAANAAKLAVGSGGGATDADTNAVGQSPVAKAKVEQSNINRRRVFMGEKAWLSDSSK